MEKTDLGVGGSINDEEFLESNVRVEGADDLELSGAGGVGALARVASEQVEIDTGARGELERGSELGGVGVEDINDTCASIGICSPG